MAARATMAAESKERKATEAANLAAKAREEARRIRETTAVVDDDIDDDIAGFARKNYDLHSRGWEKGQ